MLDELRLKIKNRKNNPNKKGINFNLKIDLSFFTVLMLALAYFIYPEWQGVFGIAIYSAVMGLTVIFACIPFVGVIVQILVYYFWLAPAALAFTGIWHTWLTLILWGVALTVGIVLCVVITFFILVALFDD